MPLPDDPRAALRRLYRDVHGYDDDPQGEAQVVAAGSSPTYGELMPAAIDRLATHLDLGPSDSFFDLGSGLGRVVLHIAMTVPITRCVGIELMPRRYRIARRILEQVRSEDRIVAGSCTMRHADFMRARLNDATVIYTCSTAFSTALMNTLAAKLATLSPGLRWVSTQDVDDNPWFEAQPGLRLDMSWRRNSPVHVYRLVHPRRRS